MLNFEDFRQHFTKTMLESGYEEFGSGERHGSEELTWSRQPKTYKDEVTRFVVLAVTPEALPCKYTVEVWGGVDDSKGFARFLFASFQGVEPDQLKKEPFVSSLKSALRGAAIRADSMTQDELTNRHITMARYVK